jgi:hypothetical protein
MAVNVNTKNAREVVVVGEFGVHYEGVDYWPGEVFTCTESWVANLEASGRVREATNKDREAAAKKSKG